MEKKRRKEWASQSKNEETYHKNRQSNWHTISVFIFFYFKQINRALPNTISIRTEVCETKEKRTKKYNKCRGRRNASLLVVFFSERPGFINVISIDFGHCVRMEDFEVKI